MPNLCSLTLSLAGLLITLPGCATMSETFTAMRPPTGGYQDSTEESSDPWVQAVGDQARGHQIKEKEADPLGLRNLLTSQKARDIESNLGYE